MKRDVRTNYLLLVLVLLLLALVGGSQVYRAQTGQSIIAFFADFLHSCKERPTEMSSRMAIIRIDDIQSYFLEDISIKMIDDAKSRGVPLSLGVIPKAIDESTPIYRYLKKNLCRLEIAQHGWDHHGTTPDTPEFDVDRATAAADIEQGKIILEKLAEERITTFIPPQNVISEGARQAVARAGIPIISSEGSALYDYGATTFNYLTDSLNSSDTIIRDCETRVAQTSFCVVVMHPQDFATNNALDPAKYALYLDTLDRLQAADYTFVRFQDLLRAD